MTRLLVSTDDQTFNIIPRSYSNLAGATIVITQDGSKKTETISDATFIESGDLIQVTASFSILEEDGLYSMEIKKDSTLLFRGKIYSTSKTDTTVNHTLNTNKYQEQGDDSGQKFIMI